jgi:hypothetical protein
MMRSWDAARCSVITPQWLGRECSCQRQVLLLLAWWFWQGSLSVGAVGYVSCLHVPFSSCRVLL